MSEKSFAALLILLATVFTVVYSAVRINLAERDIVPAVHAANMERAMPVPVIDAGHGGEDGGAVSLDGTRESTINLAIAQRCEQLFAFCGVPPVMTRTDENIDYPADASTVRSRKSADLKARAALVNATPDAALISIHQNKFTTAQPSGAQVFYAEYSGSGELAEAVQSCLEKIAAGNKRCPAKADGNLYLMRSVRCPAILIECGFLSNPGDAALLVKDDYQKKLSLSVVCGFFSEYNVNSEETA